MSLNEGEATEFKACQIGYDVVDLLGRLNKRRWALDDLPATAPPRSGLLSRILARGK